MRRLVFMMVALLVCAAAQALTPRRYVQVLEFRRHSPCPATGSSRGPCPGWQVDHVIPLKCDGPDAPQNMQWLSVADHKAKTRREVRWCRRSVYFTRQNDK